VEINCAGTDVFKGIDRINKNKHKNNPAAQAEKKPCGGGVLLYAYVVRSSGLIGQRSERYRRLKNWTV